VRSAAFVGTHSLAVAVAARAAQVKCSPRIEMLGTGSPLGERRTPLRLRGGSFIDQVVLRARFGYASIPCLLSQWCDRDIVHFMMRTSVWLCVRLAVPTVVISSACSDTFYTEVNHLYLMCPDKKVERQGTEQWQELKMHRK